MNIAQKFGPDFDAALEKAISTQLHHSREEFNKWLSGADLVAAIQTEAGELPPVMQDTVRLMTHRLCWEGWKAREAEIAIFNLQLAAARDLAQEYLKLQTTCDELTATYKKLRATLDSMLNS